MLANDGSASHVEGRCKPAVGAEQLSANGGADDIDNGVDRADLVKVNLPNGNGVYRRFGFAQKLKGVDGAGLHSFREGGCMNDFENR